MRRDGWCRRTRHAAPAAAPSPAGSPPRRRRPPGRGGAAAARRRGGDAVAGQLFLGSRGWRFGTPGGGGEKREKWRGRGAGVLENKLIAGGRTLRKASAKSSKRAINGRCAALRFRCPPHSCVCRQFPCVQGRFQTLVDKVGANCADASSAWSVWPREVPEAACILTGWFWSTDARFLSESPLTELDHTFFSAQLFSANQS